MAGIKDLTGKTFGKLTVVSFVERKKNRTWWFCHCSCGGSKSVVSSHLIQGLIRSCGCLRSESLIKYNQENKKKSNFESAAWRGYGELSLTYFSVVKVGAEKRNLEFTISIEDAWDQFLAQNRKCALSGVELKFKTSRNINDGTASLDRIDSSKGYSKNNIQWVHKEVNFMKQDFDEEKFLNWCKLIIDYKYSS